MKNKIFSSFLAFVLAVLFVLPVQAKGKALSQAEQAYEQTLAYRLKSADVKSAQAWIDSALTKNAGLSAEWDIITLSQRGDYDFSGYQAALLRYLKANEISSSASRQKYALALIASGSHDPYIAETLEISLENQSVMCLIFGLHLLNNGYVSQTYTADTLRKKLLSCQKDDGGWALFGKYSDVDVTAMTVQALAPAYGQSRVRSAVEKAISLLSERQRDDGDFSSMGTPNCESTAQVLTALSALGIDGASDSRFVKDGKTVLDGLFRYQTEEGGFLHQTGAAVNDTATTQAFYALVAYSRMCQGKSPLYVLDHRDPSALKAVFSAKSDASKSQKGSSATSGKKKNDLSSSTSTSSSSVSEKSGAVSSASSQPTEAFSENITSTEKTVPSSDQTVTSETSSPTEITDSSPGDTSAEKLSVSEKPVKTVGYKPFVCAGILILAALAAGWLTVKKKWTRKNTLLLAGLTVLALLFILLTNFQSAGQYRTVSQKENAVGTVVLSIDCHTVANRTDQTYVPENGVILPETSFSIAEGDTVFDVLQEAVKVYGIQMEKKGSGGMVYIASLGYLYELQFGDQSGWVYHVNGDSPFVGCDQYRLSDGDRVEWLYTLDLGMDVGNTFKMAGEE